MKIKPPAEPLSWSLDLPEELGIAALKKGKVAVILLAGGVGSRLGWEGPKGTFPVTPFRKRTLFQLFTDKIKAASLSFGKEIPVAVLTSKGNTKATQEAFTGTNFTICEQGELPYLDKENHPLPYFGPDGNGTVFQVLENEGILKKWEESGVELVTVVLVDNPLADPIDTRWIDFHLRGGFDLTLKVIKKESPEEKVGLLVMTDHGLQVVEYNEIDDKTGLDYANISLLLMNLSFARECAAYIDRLPLHRQWKEIEKNVWGWKQERYIFDHFPLTEKIAPLLYSREQTFVPLKQRDDLEKVRRALSQKERKILQKITGTKIDEAVLEIDPRFYYPTPELLNKWNGQSVGKGPYIDGDNR